MAQRNYVYARTTRNPKPRPVLSSGLVQGWALDFSLAGHQEVRWPLKWIRQEEEEGGKLGLWGPGESPSPTT